MAIVLITGVRSLGFFLHGTETLDPTHLGLFHLGLFGCIFRTCMGGLGCLGWFLWWVSGRRSCCSLGSRGRRGRSRSRSGKGKFFLSGFSCLLLFLDLLAGGCDSTGGLFGRFFGCLFHGFGRFFGGFFSSLLFGWSLRGISRKLGRVRMGILCT